MVDSVIRGNSIVREAHYFLDGVLTDPTLPRVTFRDSLGIAQLVDAVPYRVSAGIFQYNYPVPLGAALGVWTDEWQGVLAGQSAGPIISYFSVLPIGTIAPVPSSTYTYNLATDVGRVRLLIQDNDMSSVSTSLPLEQRSAAFTDEELQYLLDERHDVWRAASAALRVWAANKQLIVIARRIGKTDVDYGAIRRDLLAQADAYDKQANEQPADALAEVNWDDFSMRQILTNVYLRQN